VVRAQAIERGRYGAYPQKSAPWRSVWPTRLRALAVGHLARFRVSSRLSMFRELDPRERAILEEARAHVDFPTVSIDCAFKDFVLCRCEAVPGLRDLVTLCFRAAHEPSTAGAVSLSQREAWLPLHEELELARVPFTRVRDGGDECYLVHGVYGGEPIDHAYWCSTQRSLTFEVNGIVCELRSEAGRGPGLATMLSFVRKIEKCTKARLPSRREAASPRPKRQPSGAEARSAAQPREHQA
jgi:hypothetical protein